MIIRRTTLAALFLLLAAGGNTLAMSQSATPRTFPVPWGASAGSNYIRVIPQVSQIGIQNCAASLTDGFPPLTFTPSNQGGCPPFGQDMNGILSQLSLWSQWQEAGAPVYYSSAFSSAIGGYPKGAVLASAATVGCFWSSAVDNNTSDPDTGGANWNGYCTGLAAAGGTSTGSSNSQVVAVSPFVLQTGAVVHFKAAFSNTGPLQVNVNGAGLANVYRISQFGPSMSVGGEVHSGNMVDLEWDGTEWQCISCGVVNVGQEMVFTGTTGTVPSGWMIENGACISQTTYADLYESYGGSDQWSPGDGASCSGSQFHVKFANGRVSVAANTQGGQTGPLTLCGNVGAVCGEQQITMVQANLPSLNFTVSGSTSGYSPLIGSEAAFGIPNGASVDHYAFGVEGALFANNQFGEISGFSSLSVSGHAASGGSSSPMITLQPADINLFLVKY